MQKSVSPRCYLGHTSDSTDGSDAAGRSYGPADLKWCQCRYANFETTALFKMKDGDSDCRQVDSAQLLNP